MLLRRHISVLAAILAIVLVAQAQGPAKTQILDTLYTPGGALVNGTIQVTNPQTFTSADGFVVADTTVAAISVVNGAVSIFLVPNAGSTPSGTYYTANYNTQTGRYQEYWIVPSSGTPVTLASVRVLSPPALNLIASFNQLNPPNSSCVNEFPEWTALGWTCSSGTGTVGFSSISSGTNITATMTCGTGCILNTTGSGVLNASEIGGITVTGTPGVGQIPIATSSSAAAWADPIVSGHDANGSAPTANPVFIGGWDGTLVRSIKTDTSGDVSVVFPSTPSVTETNFPSTVDTNTGNSSASTPRVVLASNQPTLATQTVGNGTLLSGQQAVTASAAALATNTAKSVCVRSLPANTINIFLGPVGVTTATGMLMAPGDSYCSSASNTNLFYVIAASTGASVSWIASN